MAKKKPENKPAAPPVTKTSSPKSTTTYSLSTQRLYAIIIFAFSFIIYFNSVFNDYNLDDELVTRNHRLTSKGISAIPEIFSSPYYADQAGYKYEYRPIVLVSFAIEHSLFDDNAAVSHFINVLLYSLMCVLLFNVLRKILKGYNLLFPFIITLIFAAHPIHTEVVASIKNRDELLALIFSLLSLECALRYASTKKLFYPVLMLLFFYIGILAKPTIITFSLVIPLTLIMFTDTGLTAILVLTLLLGIPSALYARMNFISSQVLFVIALLLVVSFFYALRYFKGFGPIRDAWKQAFSSPESTPTEETSAVQLNYDFLKKPFVLIPFLVLAMLPVIAAGYGIYVPNFPLIYGGFAALIILYFISPAAFRVLLITPLSLLTVAALLRFNATSNPEEAALMIFLVVQSFSKDKLTRNIAIGNLSFYSLALLIIGHSTFPFIALAFAFMFNKKLWPLTLTLVAISFIFYCLKVYGIVAQHIPFNISMLTMPLLYAALFLVRQQKQKQVILAAALCIPVFLTVQLVRETSLASLPLKSSLKNDVNKVRFAETVDPTPVHAVRPLRYVEFPIANTDPISIKLGTALVILGKYLQLTFIPYPMSYYYGYAYFVPTPITSAVPIIVFIIYLAILLTALYLYRKLPVISYGILFYLITIVVFSNLFVPVPGLVGDRFLLIPTIGFCIVLVYLAGMFLKQDFFQRNLAFGGLNGTLRISIFVLLGLYSVETIVRNSEWKDHLTLFRHDINVVENSAQAQNLLGVHLMHAANAEKDHVKQMALGEEAIVHFKRVLEIYPNFLNASFDLGRTYMAMGLSDEAYKAFEHTLGIDSNFVSVYMSMALIQDAKGHTEEAIKLYEKYIERFPTQKEAYANLSYAYFKLRRFDMSINTNQRLLKISPNAFEPLENIGKTYLMTGQTDSAYVYFEREYAITPGNKNLVQTLVELSQKKGDMQKANFYQQKLQMLR